MKKSVRYTVLTIATAIALAASGCGVGGDANYSPEVDTFLKQFNSGNSTGGKDTSSTNIDGLELTAIIVPPGAGEVTYSGDRNRLLVTATPNNAAYDFVSWTGGIFANDKGTTTELYVTTNDRAITITANFRQTGKIEGTTFTDNRNGQSYPTVRIGKLTWMAKNLNFETSDSSWCYDCSKYGRLYAWNAAKRACPSGWRLPTNEDWDDLVETVGGANVAGRKLMAKSGWSDWEYGNGTDDFGFSGGTLKTA